MDLVAMSKLLADETRFKIVAYLLAQDLCVGALARRLGISEAAVSQHIQILRRGGLLTGEKRGYWTHYTVDRKMLELAAEQLKGLAELSPSRQCGCRREASSQTDGRRNSVGKCNCEHAANPRHTWERCGKEPVKEYPGEPEGHPGEGKKAE